MSSDLKISIITSSFNAAETIECTIQSVVGQDYPNIEYIIQDGLSKDATLEIAQRYAGQIAQINSEKDGGIYFGINNGIAHATGDVIGLIHSDDFYIDHQVISKIAKRFAETGADAVYADLYYVDRDHTDKIRRKWKSGNYRHGMFLNGWMPPHPTVFVKREIYEKYGVYNTTLRSAADYEFMLRVIHKNRIKLAYLPEFIVKMREGGISNQNLNNRVRANKEDRKAWEINGLKPRFYTLFAKPLRKLRQFWV